MTSREKILDKARKVAALRSSPEEHERENAKLRLDELKKRYGIEDADLHVPDKEKIAQISEIDTDPAWQMQLAAALARKHRCRLLSARGRLFFGGNNPENAASQYHYILSSLAYSYTTAWQRRLREGGIWDALEPIWRSIFRAEAVLAIAPRLSPLPAPSPEGGNVESSSISENGSDRAAVELAKIAGTGYVANEVNKARAAGHAAGTLIHLEDSWLMLSR